MFKLLLLILCWLPFAGIAAFLVVRSYSVISKMNKRGERLEQILRGNNPDTMASGFHDVADGYGRRDYRHQPERSHRMGRAARTDRQTQSDSGYNTDRRTEYRGIGTGLEDYEKHRR